MGPKLLGGGAALFAVAFILALPSIFEGEPANEVEAIRFGPSPVTKLSEAVRVTTSPSSSPQPEVVVQSPDPLAPVASPLVTSGGSESGTAATGEPGGVAKGPEDDRSLGKVVNGSQGANGGEPTGEVIPSESESDDLGEDDGDDIGESGEDEDDLGESEGDDDGEGDD